MWEPVLEFLLKKWQTDVFEIFLAILLLLFYQFVYRRDIQERIDRTKTIVDTFDRHVEDEVGVFTELKKSIEHLNESIQTINIALAKNHITKADLRNSEWKDIILRIEENTTEMFNTLLTSCTNIKKVSKEDIKKVFIATASDKRRDAYAIWEQQAIPRIILDIIDYVYKQVYPRALQYLDDILDTFSNEALTRLERDVIVASKINEYKKIYIADWKESFIEKINFKGAY